MEKDKINKKYHVWVLGCQMNESDGERISYILNKAGFKPTDASKADLIIILACSVRQKPIDRIYGKLHNLEKSNSQATVYLTGCLTDEDRPKLEERVDWIFDINDLDKFAKKVGINLSEQQCYLEYPAEYRYSNKAFVPIMTGCNNFCSYCVVPYTRGEERSRPAEKIIEEVKNLVNKDYSEIVLLGQNVNSYQAEKNESQKEDFVWLLEKINRLEGSFKVEFLTSHPKDMSDGLIEAVGKLDKLSSHIHLPVQSGDNNVLKAMNRNYSREDYLQLIDKLKENVADLYLSTDIIVGFPGETKKQFENTLDLVKKVTFDKAYIAKYSPRPGTPAKKLDDNISYKEKKRRWKILDDLINQT